MRLSRLERALRWLAVVLVCAATGAALAGPREDLFSAVRRDDGRTILTLLLRGLDPNTPDEAGRSALSLAMANDALDAAKALLASPELKVDLRNAQDESPLMLAALRGQTDLVRLLIKRGADVNKTGWTPLHYACTGTTDHQLDIVKILLDENAYIDAESPNGSTPLMMAAMYGKTEVARLLLEEGADPTLANQKKFTAIDFAQRASRPELVELISAAVRKRQPRGSW